MHDRPRRPYFMSRNRKGPKKKEERLWRARAVAGLDLLYVRQGLLAGIGCYKANIPLPPFSLLSSCSASAFSSTAFTSSSLFSGLSERGRARESPSPTECTTTNYCSKLLLLQRTISWKAKKKQRLACITYFLIPCVESKKGHNFFPPRLLSRFLKS